MIKPRKLTVVDVCAVTGYERDSLQVVLKELPPFNGYAKKQRFAREFTPHDIIALCVVYELEIHYGIKRKMIGKVSEMLSNTLSGPKIVASNAKLCISFAPPSVIYKTDTELNQDGIYISLKSVFERADQYLTYGGAIFRTEQAELKLSPVAIPVRTSRQTNA